LDVLDGYKLVEEIDPFDEEETDVGVGAFKFWFDDIHEGFNVKLFTVGGVVVLVD
jgi:hypothetical protein